MLNICKCLIHTTHITHIKLVKVNNFMQRLNTHSIPIFKICLCAYDPAMAHFLIIGIHRLKLKS